MSIVVHRPGSPISSGLTNWHEAKTFIEHASIVSPDALHVLVGTAIWLIAAIVLRRRLSAWLPWLIVLGLALFNELVDLCVERWPDVAMQYGEGMKDLALTMALPTVLLALTRRVPGLFEAPGVSRKRR